jgi:ribonucleoside-diphosphate reductase alpha chain
MTKGVDVSNATTGAVRPADTDPELEIRRYFTTEGVHPYDEIEWELRDAVIQNYRTGKVAFEQKDVEVPKAWSQNATNIAAQKYFRGSPGTLQRERSVKQMIDRVVGRYVEEGVERGYFDVAEAEVFGAELTHLLVTQKAAFNSPVWFNVGWRPKGEEQVAACQPYDALVHTPSGLIPIGKLVENEAIGQKVYDADGITRIVAVKSNGRKDVLRVHLKAGITLDATPDHLVWRKRVSGGGTAGFVPAGELRLGDSLTWHRRDSFGEDELDVAEIQEAALAGWLQSDGFVGQFYGTNKSLTIETITVNDGERDWVIHALDSVFPDVHRNERAVTTLDPALDCRRIRLYGRGLSAFVEKWGLRARGTEMEVPDPLFTAPLPVVTAYLKSIFQAEGSVSIRDRSALIAVDMISEKLIRGIQQLLTRYGIFARVRFKSDAREKRKGCWSLTIQSLGDRRFFADEIGFIDATKSAKLEKSLSILGRPAWKSKELQIVSIENLGPMDVYDIQTESGEYLSESLRVHNCYILSVEDEMDSILNWYVEEGRIFKHGSGSGINLSKIRSSKERLRSGGTASGPVSFMRGADASAGTIKSGGATRRAAKMVVLNVDHPDVKDFIWCKALEERKARALREAGFDMDIDGVDAHSIQYQNANNSVRVTDEFMQAVLDDRDWELKAITSGETLEKIRAKELFREIAQAAWECADPGLQYDTTINDWHTSPNTGRINASNPCSEYLHVDNSACNLASLNLMKFVDENDRFDVEAFKHAIEVMFLAQEISVGFAYYPTDVIHQNSLKMRQLGQGYANLGALLMSQGHAYDSDEGRAWAGAITALQTGHCYSTSAKIAKRVGAFEEYAKNEEPMLRVIGKHRAAAYLIPDEKAPSELVTAARGAWDEALELGKEHGYRNAQSTVTAPTGTIGLLMDCDTTGIEPDLALKKTKKLVGGGTMSIVNRTVPKALRKLGYDEQQTQDIVDFIDENSHVVGAPHLREEHMSVFDTAMGERSIHYMGHIKMMAACQPFISGAISKCVTGDTLITTGDGLVRIGSLHRGEPEDSFRDEFIEVASLGTQSKTDAFYYGGGRAVRRITLRSGHEITGTPNHRVLVSVAGGFEWRHLGEISPGEYVGVRYGADMWSEVPASLRDFRPTDPYGSQKVVPIPDEMSDDLALLLGAFASEGHITRSNWTITITNSVEEVLLRLKEAWREGFGIEAGITRQEGKCPAVVVSSKTVVEFFDYLGCGNGASHKRIPDAVLQSPKSMVLAYLGGLLLDGYAHNGASSKVGLCLASEGLLDDYQAVLTNLGIVHSRVEKIDKTTGKKYGDVYASGEHAQRLATLVRFWEPDKAKAAYSIRARLFRQGTADVVPGITPHDLYYLIPESKSGRGGHSLRRGFTFLLDPRTQHVSRRSLERVAKLGVRLPDWLETVLSDNLHFSPVASVDDAGMREVYDLSVPTTHAFVGNGIVNHNTVNLPENVTVEDVEQAYIEGWDLGLKALAIYRDNCKAAQPLSVSKKGDDKLAVELVTDMPTPVRRRLPKKRASKTIKFRVADTEGYITVGEFPEGGVGEIFLKVAKQGSTLAGIMDAFAISISMGLQYGVPLTAYVKQFVNTRFEPSGMTDDPDFRIATSILDYVFRVLAFEYLPKGERHSLGIKASNERQDEIEARLDDATEADRNGKGKRNGHAEEESQGEGVIVLGPVASAHVGSLPFCGTCGVQMQPAGSCFACPSCGSTSGCS